MKTCASHEFHWPIFPSDIKFVPYLHDLILELGEEEVHNLVLLDGQRVEVDLLHAGDLAGLDETTELGDGLPFLLLLLAAATTTTTTATATVTTTVTAGTESSTSTRSSVSHVGYIWRLKMNRTGRGNGREGVVEGLSTSRLTFVSHYPHTTVWLTEISCANRAHGNPIP